jgi:phasin
MIKNPTGIEIPPEMRAFAEKSVGEARKAFEGYIEAATKAFGTAEKSAEAIQSNAKDMGRKAIGFAEANINAGMDFAQKLVGARTPEEFMALQTEFIQTQMKSLSEQVKALGETATAAGKSAFESLKPKG